MQATKSKGFGGGALTDKLQLEDITSRETLREGDNVQVEVSMGPEETLKAWNSVAAKNQRRTPSDADIRKVSLGNSVAIICMHQNACLEGQESLARPRRGGGGGGVL